MTTTNLDYTAPDPHNRIPGVPVPAPVTYSTSAPTVSGVTLFFTNTAGIVVHAAVSGFNVDPASIVLSIVPNTSVTLSVNVLGIVPSSTSIMFQAPDITPYLTGAKFQDPKTSGKYYVRIDLSPLGSGSPVGATPNPAVGVAMQGADFHALAANGRGGALIFPASYGLAVNGVATINGVNGGFGFDSLVGGPIDIALDLDNMRVWFRHFVPNPDGVDPCIEPWNVVSQRTFGSTASGTVLNFFSTAGINDGDSAVGINVGSTFAQPLANTVFSHTSTSVTLTGPVSGAVPANTSIMFATPGAKDPAANTGGLDISALFGGIVLVVLNNAGNANFRSLMTTDGNVFLAGPPPPLETPAGFVAGWPTNEFYEVDPGFPPSLAAPSHLGVPKITGEFVFGPPNLAVRKQTADVVFGPPNLAVRKMTAYVFLTPPSSGRPFVTRPS